MKKIKILIVENNRLLLNGIVSMINEQLDLKVIAAINVVLIDLGLRTQNLSRYRDIKSIFRKYFDN